MGMCRHHAPGTSGTLLTSTWGQARQRSDEPRHIGWQHLLPKPGDIRAGCKQATLAVPGMQSPQEGVHEVAGLRSVHPVF